MNESEIHTKILLLDELYKLAQDEYELYKYNVISTSDRNELEVHMIKYNECIDNWTKEKSELVIKLSNTVSSILEFYFKYPDICMSKSLNERIKEDYQVNLSHLPALGRTDFTVNEITDNKTELIITEFIKYSKPNYNSCTHKILFKFSRFTSRRYACLYSDGVWDCMLYNNKTFIKMFCITSIADMLIVIHNIETAFGGRTDNYNVSIY